VRIELVPCAECRLKVQVCFAEYDRGVIPSSEYVLVGDLIFHSGCWGQIAADHPLRSLDDGEGLQEGIPAPEGEW
jgi:hypothetical protein